MTHIMSTTYRHTKQVTRMVARCTQGVPKVYPRCSQALAILMSMLRVWLEYAWKQPRVWLEYAYSEITARASRAYGPCPTRLRLVVTLLLMMVVGVNTAWGQSGTDLSGVFYFVNCGSGKTNPNDPKIADITDPNDYFYLVPADAPKQDNKRDAWYSSDYSTANGNEGTPYLTTYKTKKDAAEVPTGVTNRPHNSVWIVQSAGTDNGKDYYYLIHAATGKYVVYEPPYSANNNRKSVHLLTTNNPGEDAMFAITINSGNYNFRPKSIGTESTTNKYLNPSNRNFNYYYSHSNVSDGDANYYEGLIGLWKDKGDASDWKPEATLYVAPTISVNNNRVTVTDSHGLPSGYNVRYTFSSTGIPTDPIASSSKMDANGYLVTEAGILKVVIERYGVVLTEVAQQAVSPVPCATPVIGFDYTTSTVSITCATEGATIRYTTDDTTPTATSGTEYTVPFAINTTTTVKAIAIRTDFPNSEVAERTINLIPSPTITYNTSNQIEMATDLEGASIYYTTDGSEPSVINGRRYQNPFDPADDVTEIKAIVITSDGEKSNVATYIPPVLLGSNHIRLIQNQGNAWECAEHPGGHFYMRAASEENLTTTSLFLPDDQWYFLNAGDGYYYIIHDEKRLWCDGTNIKLKTFDSETPDQFKFRLVPYPETGTTTDYNIVPFGLTEGITKPGGNGTSDVIALGSSNSEGYARWKFILPSAFDKTAPFTVSNDNQSYFYKIGSGNQYIIQSSETAVTTTASTADEDVKKGSWMMMLVPDTEISVGDEFTYYNIRNAKTNDYLYYNDGGTPGFAVSATITEGQEDNYRFTWARSTATDTYYLIPRTQVNAAKSSLINFSTYSITAAPGFVLDPVLTMDAEGIITMTCATSGSEIFYRIDGDYTDEEGANTAKNPEIPAESGKKPTLPTRLYSTDFLLSLDATQVRAVAVLKNDHTVQSAVQLINLTQCGTPNPSEVDFHDAQGSLTIPKVKVGTVGEGDDEHDVYADIYYTIDGTEPVLVETTAHGVEPEIAFRYNTRSKVWAVAAKNGMRKSEPYKMDVVYMPTITLQQESYTYSATITDSKIVSQAIEPVITKVQVEGEAQPIATTDYHVTGYRDNTEAGTGKIIIKATSTASIKLYGIGNFTINKAPISSITVTPDPAMFTYNYRAQGPEITSIIATGGNGNIELLGFDAYYTVTDNLQVSAGEYTLRVEAKEGTNFTDYVEKTFTIKSKTLNADDIYITVKKEVNGNTVSYVPTLKDGSVTLVEDKDYTYTVDTTNGIVLTFTGKGNYSSLEADKRIYEFIDLPFVRPENSNSDYVAPYAASSDLTTPLGMNAYIVTGVTNKDRVILEEVTYIPKDVPVLLLSGKRADGFGKVVKTSDTYTADELSAINTKNKLKVNASATEIEAALIYLFYKGEFVLNAAGTLPAGKVYLDLRDTSDPTPAPRLSIVGGDNNTTEIEDVRYKEENVQSERWFTLDGRMLQGKPTQKGLYIKNGSKIVIR